MESISAKAVSELEALGWAPSDYVEWVRSFGWGEVAGASYMVYECLVPLDEFVRDAPAGVWTFGDNLAGTNGCFVAGGDGAVYEWDSAVSELSSTGVRFPEFIARHGQ